MESRHPRDACLRTTPEATREGGTAWTRSRRHQVTRTSRSGHRIRNVAVVVLGLVLGLGFALGPRILDDADASNRGDPLPSGAVPLGSLSTQLVADAAASAGDAVASVSLELDPPAAPAPSAPAAIEAFLTAEVSGRYDVSYGLLSAPDRTRAGGRAQWVANHANLPPMTGFAIESVAESGDEASVVTATDLRSSLDEIIGLVPGARPWIVDGRTRRRRLARRLLPQPPGASVSGRHARRRRGARVGDGAPGMRKRRGMGRRRVRPDVRSRRGCAARRVP